MATGFRGRLAFHPSGFSHASRWIAQAALRIAANMRTDPFVAQHALNSPGDEVRTARNEPHRSTAADQADSPCASALSSLLESAHACSPSDLLTMRLLWQLQSKRGLLQFKLQPRSMHSRMPASGFCRFNPKAHFGVSPPEPAHSSRGKSIPFCRC
jgi:hypothetical protein